MKTTEFSTLDWKDKTMFTGKKVTSLFIDNIETNIYFFENDTEAEAKAHKTANLIKRGEIYPQDGQWKFFDICGHIEYKIEAIEETQESPGAFNNLLSRSGHPIPQEKKQEIIDSLIGKTEYSQWIKMYDKSLNKLNKLCVKFYPYGYTVFFK